MINLAKIVQSAIEMEKNYILLAGDVAYLADNYITIISRMKRGDQIRGEHCVVCDSNGEMLGSSSLVYLNGTFQVVDLQDFKSYILRKDNA